MACNRTDVQMIMRGGVGFPGGAREGPASSGPDSWDAAGASQSRAKHVGRDEARPSRREARSVGGPGFVRAGFMGCGRGEPVASQARRPRRSAALPEGGAKRGRARLRPGRIHGMRQGRARREPSTQAATKRGPPGGRREAWEGPASSGPDSWDAAGASPSRAKHAGRDEARPSRRAARSVGGPGFVRAVARGRDGARPSRCGLKDRRCTAGVTARERGCGTCGWRWRGRCPPRSCGDRRP